MKLGALLGLVAGLLVASVAVRATELDDVAAERVLLLDARAEVEARFEGRVRNCEQRIFVNDCLNRARKERREALLPIDDRVATLDEADRTRRADERRAAIAAKRAAQAAEPAASGAAPELPARLPKAKRGVLLAQPPASAPAQPTPAERAREERAARERYDRKQAEAAAHRAQLLQRNADRSKPAAAPLPSASAP